MMRNQVSSIFRRCAGVLIPAAVLAACDSPTASAPAEPVVATVAVQGAPASLVVGQEIALNARVQAVDGTVLNRQVTWTTSDTAVATVSSAGLLIARSAGSVEVRAAAAGRSGAAQIQVVYGAPTATQLQPAGALSGDAAFELTVRGTGFAPGAVVLWNGTLRPTRVVSATEVRADIMAADVRDAGLASVVVVNPALPGNAASERLYFTIAPRPAPPSTVYRLMGLETSRGLPVEVSRHRWTDDAGVAHPAIQRVVAGTLTTTREDGNTLFQLAITFATYLEATGVEVDRDTYSWWGTMMVDMWTGMPVLTEMNFGLTFRTTVPTPSELVIYQVLNSTGDPAHEKAWLYEKQ